MIKIKKIIAMITLIGMFNTALLADELQDLTTMMKSKVEYVVKVLKDTNLTKVEQDKKLNESIEGLFDYTLMARLSIGKHEWMKLESAKKQEFVKLFSQKMKDSYTEKSHMLSNEKIVVKPAQMIKKSRISVPVLIEGTKKSTKLVYKFYHSKKAIWLIYDVEIAGVSILQTYRAQFAEELSSGNIDTLMKKLEKSK
jgi:phospholipid transport system substrate-binding protein